MVWRGRLGWVVVVGCAILSLSCGVGERRVRRAWEADDLDLFLEGFREAVIANDTELILREYIDPGYRREQLEGLLEGNQEQFFDELFGLGRKGFGDIVDLEFVCEEVRFEALAHGGDGGASRTLPTESRDGVQCTPYGLKAV